MGCRNKGFQGKLIFFNWCLGKDFRGQSLKGGVGCEKKSYGYVCVLNFSFIVKEKRGDIKEMKVEFKLNYWGIY